LLETQNGVALIAGKRKDGRYWARQGEEFLPGSFESLEDAKCAPEANGIAGIGF